MFSHEPIIFDDMCEVKKVKSAIYLDFDEKLSEGEHDYRFVGRVGQFSPMKDGVGGGRLVKSKDKIKYDYVTGAKGFRWMESEVVRKIGKEKDVNELYYHNLVDKSIEAISNYGNYEWFVSDDPVPPVGSPLFDLSNFMNIPDTDEEEIPFN